MKLNKAYDFTIGDVVNFTTVFIHGIAADATSFEKFFEYLKQEKNLNARIIAYDLLGAGNSPKSSDLEYGMKDQTTALAESLEEIQGPIVLVGHSMGTFITTKFTKEHPEKIQKLILISPPIYRPEDLKNPDFMLALEGFKESVRKLDPELVETRMFKNELEDIVMREDNYDTLTKINRETTLIYGEKDRIIASFNIPQVLKSNKLISAIKTVGGHGISSDKFEQIKEEIENVKAI